MEEEEAVTVDPLLVLSLDLIAREGRRETLTMAVAALTILLGGSLLSAGENDR